MKYKWVIDELKKWLIDYRFKKTGSNEDGRYCIAISITDMLKKIEELEKEINVHSKNKD